MKTTGEFDPVSVANYLAGEETAVEKHEYVCGEVYAQAGGTNAHNRIATNRNNVQCTQNGYFCPFISFCFRRTGMSNLRIETRSPAGLSLNGQIFSMNNLNGSLSGGM